MALQGRLWSSFFNMGFKMNNNKKYLIIIPARGGSKGVKNKNIVKISKKTLLEYTSQEALKVLNKLKNSKLILSTDSIKIANVGKKLNLEVPFLRPNEFSKDKSKSIDLILHALNYYKKINILFDSIILLQPTSPLRTHKDIINSIKLFENNFNDSLISCYKDETLDLSLIYNKNDNNQGFALNSKHSSGLRRQDSSNLYVRNGAIYITSVEYLKKHKKIISDSPLIYEMPKSRSINIDTKEDLILLKKILKK